MFGNLPGPSRPIRAAGICLLGPSAFVASGMLVWPYLTAGPPEAPLEVRRTGSTPPPHDARGMLRVMTLNLAHGRGKALHQALLDGAAIRRNLDEVSAVLRRDAALVVGVQEADARSFWSGGFNHVEYLARTAGFSHFAVGRQVQGMRLDYGVGILSRIPIPGGTTHRFRSRGLTANKGFVLCTVRWPGSGFPDVDFAVLHLDHLRSSTRARQLDEVAAAIGERTRPVIIVGDFNATWQDPDGLLRRFVQDLDLRAFEPDRTDLGTYPGDGRRLDWILVSAELDVVRYGNLPDSVSDHSAVVAELRVREGR